MVKTRKSVNQKIGAARYQGSYRTWSTMVFGRPPEATQASRTLQICRGARPSAVRLIKLQDGFACRASGLWSSSRAKTPPPRGASSSASPRLEPPHLPRRGARHADRARARPMVFSAPCCPVAGAGRDRPRVGIRGRMRQFHHSQAHRSFDASASRLCLWPPYYASSPT